MEQWKRVWRDAVAPLLSEKSLRALKVALETDDPRLVQGCTTTPPPKPCMQDWPVEAACALGYCGVEECGGFGKATVGEVEEYFARLAFSIDEKLREPAGVRHLLNWVDETPRAIMLRELLPEVQAALEARVSCETERTEELTRREMGET